MDNSEMSQQPDNQELETTVEMPTGESVVQPFFASEIAEAKERKIKDCRQGERDLVLVNPEAVGINFDQDFIVDSRGSWPLERCLKYAEDGGKVPDKVMDTLRSDKAGEFLVSRQADEAKKMSSFREYLASFEGKLQHARIHPAAETSPVSPSQAIEHRADGGFDVVIAQEFIDQLKILSEQTSDLTLVIPFYDHRRGKENASDVPETSEQIDEYVAICEKIIESFGSEVQLEIGNETNVSRKSSGEFGEVLQFASHVDATEYARFYYEVATRVKEINPDVKLSISGVACYDPTYLREVLTEVSRLQAEAGKNTSLVDTISFHPYTPPGGSPEGGSSEVIGGTIQPLFPTELDYKKEIEEMQRLASEFAVKLSVGEINFPSSDPEQHSKLAQSLSLSTKEGIDSYIYPGVNVH